MIAKGLLERERSALDARANAVRLTDAGRAALAEAAPKMAAADARLLKLLPPASATPSSAALAAVAAGRAPQGRRAERPPEAGKGPEEAAKKAKKKAKKAPPEQGRPNP